MFGDLMRGEISQQRTVELVAALAGALAHAHHRGVYHLDVKPGNVLIDERDAEPGQGIPLLADFGLAHVAYRTSNVAGGDGVGGKRMGRGGGKEMGSGGGEGEGAGRLVVDGELCRRADGMRMLAAAGLTGRLVRRSWPDARCTRRGERHRRAGVGRMSPERGVTLNMTLCTEQTV